MRKIKLISVLVSVALMLNVWPNVATAQDGTPPTIPGLDGSPSKLKKADLQKFVDLAFSEEITVPQAQAFYEQLTSKQKDVVSDLVATKASIPLDEWRQAKELYEQEVVSQLSDTSHVNISESILIAEIWRQPIEPHTGMGAGTVTASSYWADPYCENASPPDPDTDWIFYFSMTYSMNPDGLRWSTSSTQVWLALLTAYGGNLNSYAYYWNSVYVCLGTTGVSAAGGAANVRNNLRLRAP
ncbi:MAG: hypothetical protein HYZ49_11200 [Chloroflexi bacterium]|nr:hypothetical protein [Chloroflexota bacterium]